MPKYVALTNLQTSRGFTPVGAVVELDDDEALSLAEHDAIGVFAGAEVPPETDAPVAIPQAQAEPAEGKTKPKRRKAKES